MIGELTQALEHIVHNVMSKWFCYRAGTDLSFKGKQQSAFNIFKMAVFACYSTYVVFKWQICDGSRAKYVSQI